MRQSYTTILGVKVSAITYHQALSTIQNWIDKNEKEYVCVSNVHSIMECQKDPKLLSGVNKAGLVTPDGMPLVWLSKLYGRKVGRVYGPNLLDKLCRLSERKNYKVFFFGGTEGLSKGLSEKISKIYPKLKVVDYIEAPKRPISDKKNKIIIKKINSSNVQFVFVGLGCPYQEYWMIDNRNKLNTSVLIGVGAAFDFMSGRVRQAPTWMQNIGFEWLFRLSQDPKRLWRRYTITNLQFLIKIFKQINKDLLFKGKHLTPNL